jgi:hypothetical protein
MDPKASGSNSSGSTNSTSGTQKNKVWKRRLTKEQNDITEAKETTQRSLSPAVEATAQAAANLLM